MRRLESKKGIHNTTVRVCVGGMSKWETGLGELLFDLKALNPISVNYRM